MAPSVKNFHFSWASGASLGSGLAGDSELGSGVGSALGSGLGVLSGVGVGWGPSGVEGLVLGVGKLEGAKLGAVLGGMTGGLGVWLERGERVVGGVGAVLQALMSNSPRAKRGRRAMIR